MGKYMKKSKITGDIAVMEVSPHDFKGVRTRAAKTLALQRLIKPSSLSAVAASSSYLQLRSRRLEKPPVFRQQQRGYHSRDSCRGSSSPDYSLNNSRLKQDSAKSASVGLVSLDLEEESEKRNVGVETESGNVADGEASFCENYLEFGVENGRTAEKTPSNLVSDSSTIETSHSMRKEMDSRTSDSRVEMDLLRSIPTSNEIEEFFAHEELWHQRMFMQKYNFDFANDMPLQGRYEWVQMSPLM